jgi:hypothetical protein
MMGFILDLLLELGERLGSGLIKLLRGVPLKARIFILTILLIAAAFMLYPDLFRATSTLCSQWVMASFNKAAIPLRGEGRQELDSQIRNLGELLYSGYYSKRIERLDEKAVPPGPWVPAQVAVALSGLNLPNRKPINPSKIVSLLDKTRSSDCGIEDSYCWKEGPSDDARRANVGVSAWVIYAKAHLGASAKPEEIRFLLSMQNKDDDSWPMLPCKGGPTSGSTYATAWAIMALGEQGRRGLIEEPMLAEVNDSIRAGLFWLESQKRAENGLWWSYPSKGWPGEISISNSGLAVHVIHEFEHEPLQEVEQKWMANLKGRRAYAYGAETFNSWVCSGKDVQRDFTRYMILPWELIATVDSYSQGNIAERARAIKLVESIILEKEKLQEEIKQEYFVAAEILIALRHLRESYLASEPAGAPNPIAKADG